MADAYTIARPYAEAVYEQAQEMGRVGEWESELSLLAAIAADEAMERLLENPRVDEERKRSVFTGVAGDRLSDGGKRLLDLLFANQRVAILPAALELFQEMRRKAEGEVRAEVRSAYALEEQTESAIAQALEKKFGKRVSVVSHVDEELMGGLVIQAGDLVIDGSVRGGLQQLRNRLKA